MRFFNRAANRHHHHHQVQILESESLLPNHFLIGVLNKVGALYRFQIQILLMTNLFNVLDVRTTSTDDYKVLFDSVVGM